MIDVLLWSINHLYFALKTLKYITICSILMFLVTKIYAYNHVLNKKVIEK
jgi:hypothetical protein